MGGDEELVKPPGEEEFREYGVEKDLGFTRYSRQLPKG